MFNLNLYIRYTKTRTEILNEAVAHFQGRTFQSQNNCNETSRQHFAKVHEILVSASSVDNNLKSVEIHFGQLLKDRTKKMDNPDAICTALKALGERLQGHDLVYTDEIFESNPVKNGIDRFVEEEATKLDKKNFVMFLNEKGKIEYRLKQIMRNVFFSQESLLRSNSPSNKPMKVLEVFVINTVFPVAIKRYKEITSTPENILIDETSGSTPSGLMTYLSNKIKVLRSLFL